MRQVNDVRSSDMSAGTRIIPDLLKAVAFYINFCYIM